MFTNFKIERIKRAHQIEVDTYENVINQLRHQLMTSEAIDTCIEMMAELKAEAITKKYEERIATLTEQNNKMALELESLKARKTNTKTKRTKMSDEERRRKKAEYQRRWLARKRAEKLEKLNADKQ